MENLTLVTTEKFNNSIECNFYKNNNDEILLTRKQIGLALEYSNPDVALSKIHSRHKSRLDKFSVIANLKSTDGKIYETILYTRKGIMEICRYSNKPKADLFVDWVWDITEKQINNSNNIDVAIIPSTSDKTPIEIALQIDSNGMTTASKLYSFLELDSAHFSRWCNKNIVKNKFATENKDYIVFTISGENLKGGRPKTDYKLTSEFAKKLSMTGNSERHEQARDYFIACEQGLKVATEKLHNNADLKSLSDSITTLAQEISTGLHTMNENISILNKRVSTLEESQTKALPKKKYSYWSTKMFPKYQALMEYFEITQYKELYKQLFREFQNIYPEIELNQIVDDYCYDNNLDSCFTLEAIEYDKATRTLFEQMVNNLLEKYNLVTEKDSTVVPTIFDRKPSL